MLLLMEPTHQLRPTHRLMWAMHRLVQATLTVTLLTKVTHHLRKDTHHLPKATLHLCRVVIHLLWAIHLHREMFSLCQWLQEHLSCSLQRWEGAVTLLLAERLHRWECRLVFQAARPV